MDQTMLIEAVSRDAQRSAVYKVDNRQRMFIDEALIHVKAGDGGHGCVSFRRGCCDGRAGNNFHAGGLKRHWRIVFGALISGFLIAPLLEGCGAKAVAPVSSNSSHISNCDNTGYDGRPPMPNLNELVTQQPRWLKLSASVLGHQLNGTTVDLRIQVVNPATQPVGLMVFDYMQPERRFAIWVTEGGRQVPLTCYGKKAQPRITDGPWFGGGPTEFIECGSSYELHVDLTRLFQLPSGEPGRYVVIVEDRPFGGDHSESDVKQTVAKDTITFRDSNGKVVTNNIVDYRQLISLTGFGAATTTFDIGD